MLIKGVKEKGLTQALADHWQNKLRRAAIELPVTH
jgi:hypothetical protein